MTTKKERNVFYLAGDLQQDYGIPKRTSVEGALAVLVEDFGTDYVQTYGRKAGIPVYKIELVGNYNHSSLWKKVS